MDVLVTLGTFLLQQRPPPTTKLFGSNFLLKCLTGLSRSKTFFHNRKLASIGLVFCYTTFSTHYNYNSVRIHCLFCDSKQEAVEKVWTISYLNSKLSHWKWIKNESFWLVFMFFKINFCLHLQKNGGGGTEKSQVSLHSQHCQRIGTGSDGI